MVWKKPDLEVDNKKEAWEEDEIQEVKTCWDCGGTTFLKHEKSTVYETGEDGVARVIGKLDSDDGDEELDFMQCCSCGLTYDVECFKFEKKD
jgi:hypothetical protein